MSPRKLSPRSTPEQRKHAVEKYLASQKTAKEIATELGMYPATLESWIRDYKRAQVNPNGTLSETQLNELIRLQRENASLARENELLKKADAFFRELDRSKKSSKRSPR